MKRITLFIISLGCMLYSFAQGKSNLTISTTGNSNLKIRLSNKKYSLQDRSITFQSMQPGTYNLTIFQLRKKPDGGTEYATVFDKTITLNPQRHTEICVLRFGKVAFDESNIEKDDWNDSYNNPAPDRGYDNNNNNNGNNWNPVSPEDFARIKKAIDGEFSEDNKMQMAKVVLKNNLFTAFQLKQLCELFFSDDKKLAFAKYAYDYCVDKGNYYTLAETLFSSNNKKDLLSYIAER
jgi:hypothetical protein